MLDEDDEPAIPPVMWMQSPALSATMETKVRPARRASPAHLALSHRVRLLQLGNFTSPLKVEDSGASGEGEPLEALEQWSRIQALREKERERRNAEAGVEYVDEQRFGGGIAAERERALKAQRERRGSKSSKGSSGGGELSFRSDEIDGVLETLEDIVPPEQSPRVSQREKLFRQALKEATGKAGFPALEPCLLYTSDAADE